MNRQKLLTVPFMQLCATAFFMTVAFNMLLPTLPVYIKDALYATNDDVGMVMAAYAFAALLFRPLSGYILDSFGRKYLFIITVFLFGTTFFIYPIPHIIVGVLVLRFFHGALWGATTTTGATLVVDIVHPSIRGKGIGIYGSIMALTMAIGPLVGLEVMERFSYEVMFYVAGGIGIIGFIFSATLRYPEFRKPKESLSVLKNLISVKCIPISIVMLFICITFGGMVSFITLYTKEYSIPGAGSFFLVYAMAVVVTRATVGSYFDKHGPKLLSFVGLFLLFIGFPLIVFQQNIYGLLIGAASIGLGMGIIMPTYQAIANNLVLKSERGLANSTFYTAFDLGVSSGALLFGFLSSLVDMKFAFLICSVLIFAAMLYYFLFVHKHYEQNRVFAD